jgi:transcriptional regulator GlxA family with amidase domain
VYSEITFQYRKQPGPIDSWSGLLGRWTGSSCALPHYTSTASTTVEEIREITRAIVTATYTRHPQLPKLLQGYLAQSLFVVWRDLVADRSGPLEPDKLVQAQRFIEQHSHRPIGLEDVAAHVGWSPKHLGRAFKERFGLSPMSYRRTLSLERAAVLLRTSNHAIKGIASLLGFDDVQYFHRAFRKLHGVPPAQYRRLSMNAPGSHQHSKRSSDSA